MNNHSSEFGVRNSESGSVLVYVVWTIALLSLFAVSIASRALFSLGLTERLTEQMQSAYLARGAAQHVALTLARDATPSIDGFSDEWASNPGRFQRRQLGEGLFDVMSAAPDGRTAYGLADEDRRINLNTAPAEMLQRLGELVGMTEDEAVRWAAAVEDWRDEDDREQPRGAEGIYYRSLSDGYDCKNAPFEHPEELLLIRGITPELYERLKPHITTYGSGFLNLNTATPLALASLGLSQAGLDGFAAYQVGEDGVGETGDERVLVSLGSLNSELALFVPPEDIARLTLLSEFLGVGSSEFRMTIAARLDRPSSATTVECLMNRDGQISVWEER